MTEQIDIETGEVTEVSDNLRHWNALGRTDPAHTKAFQRAGGFRGTATRPIWTEWRMTEHFGPCGVGWGMGKPEFECVNAGEEMLVFCTLMVWYRDGRKRAEVWGVGGDKVVVKQQSGLRASDEAFKAATTDALSNALKHIGVAADIHMGLFEDEKYVRETARMYNLTELTVTTPKQAEQPRTQRRDASNDAAKNLDAIEAARARGNLAASHIKTMIDECNTIPEIDEVFAGAAWTEALRVLQGAAKDMNEPHAVEAVTRMLRDRAENRKRLLMGGERSPMEYANA